MIIIENTISIDDILMVLYKKYLEEIRHFDYLPL